MKWQKIETTELTTCIHHVLVVSSRRWKHIEEVRWMGECRAYFKKDVLPLPLLPTQSFWPLVFAAHVKEGWSALNSEWWGTLEWNYITKLHFTICNWCIDGYKRNKATHSEILQSFSVTERFVYSVSWYVYFIWWREQGYNRYITDGQKFYVE